MATPQGINFKPLKHHKFSEKLRPFLKHNLSNSCSETWTVSELLDLDDNRQEFSDLPLTYTSVRGELNLRKNIATLYNQSTDKITADDALVFAGGQEALFATTAAIVNTGDEVIVVTPCYPTLDHLPEILGAVVHRVMLKEEDNWQLNTQDVAELINDKTKLIIVNSPHNPTGMTFDQAKADELIALAKAHDLFILADEVSVLMDFRNLNIENQFTKYKKSILIGVMAKSFGLSGLRIGWTICQDPEINQAMFTVKTYTAICCSGPDSYLARLALEKRDHLLSRNHQIIRDNISIFNDFLSKKAFPFTWIEPQAGLLALVKLSAGSVSKFADQLAKETGILIMPGELFGIEGNYFRLGLGQRDFQVQLSSFGRFAESFDFDI